MPFQKAEIRTATIIPTIRLAFSRADGVAGASEYTAEYELVVIDQHGQRMVFDGAGGDLIPHLTTQERAQLVAMIDRLHQLAKTELLS